jgi:phenylacetate-CoA ligase
MLLVRGVNLFPSALQSVVGRFVPKVSGRIQIVLQQPGPKVEPPLKLRVEHAQGVADEELAELKKSIQSAIRSDLSVTTDVELVPTGALGRTETKTRLIVVQSQ